MPFLSYRCLLHQANPNLWFDSIVSCEGGDKGCICGVSIRTPLIFEGESHWRKGDAGSIGHAATLSTGAVLTLPRTLSYVGAPAFAFAISAALHCGHMWIEGL